jgi:DNA-directed RNA polymerase specialized sigma24 family protein
MQLARRQTVMLPLELEHDPQKENGSPEIVDPAALPDAAIVQLEDQHTVRTIMGALDERCLQLLTLLFYRPTPAAYEHIAKQLGIPAGSVGPTRARCLQKLRRLLQDADF